MNTQKMQEQNKETSSQINATIPELIPGTPFHTIKIGNQYGIVFGKWAISKKTFSTRSAAKKFITENFSWDILMMAVGIYVDYAINENNLKQLKIKENGNK